MATPVRNVGANPLRVFGSTGVSPATPAVGPLGGAGPRQPPGGSMPLAGLALSEGMPLTAYTWAYGEDGDERPALARRDGFPDVAPTEGVEADEVVAVHGPGEMPGMSDEPTTPDEPAVSTKPRDEFERAARPVVRQETKSAGPTPVCTSRADASPFAPLVPASRATPALVQSSTVLPPLAAPERDPAAAPLPLEQLGHLAFVAAPLAASGSSAPQRVIVGSMLVATDAQVRDLPGVETMASVVLRGNQKATAEHFETWLRSSNRILAAAQQNVAALVQQVLRESYLMTTDVLLDYANKVKFFNEQKKKVRQLLESARNTRSAWAQQAQTLKDQAFVADRPFEYRDIDTITGELFTPTMSEEDVQRWKAVDEARKPGKGSSPLDDYALLNGESRLTASERATVDEMLRDHNGDFWSFSWIDDKNDNYVCDHINDLTAVIPNMNKDELKQYVLPIIEMLTGGNTDESELFDIFRALKPVQYLYIFSNGFDASQLNLQTTEVVKDGAIGSVQGSVVGAVAGGSVGHLPGLIIGTIAGGVIGAAGGIVAGLKTGGFDSGEQAELRLIGKNAAIAAAAAVGQEFTGDLDPQNAASILVALEAKTRASAAQADASSTNGATVGSPKLLRTTDEMDAYIKALEEKLNGLGDDAQLANVDLQNELQKQQQTLQMMSNLSKMLFDTGMAVIRKIGG